MTDLIDRPDTEFTQGQLTHKGVEVDGEIKIPRQKPKKYADLTTEQNYTLERWTKEALRDYPTMDPWWAETIAYHCLVKPEEAEKYAGENEDKIFQTYEEANACWNKIEQENKHVERESPFVDFNMLQGNVNFELFKPNDKVYDLDVIEEK